MEGFRDADEGVEVAEEDEDDEELDSGVFSFLATFLEMIIPESRYYIIVT